MMESLILLLLSSGLYSANHGTAMTAHANRGFGAVGWNGMPVPSRARGAAGRAMRRSQHNAGSRAPRLCSRGTTCRQPPAASRQPPPTTGADGEAERHAAVAWRRRPTHRGAAVRRRLPVRCCCLEERRASSRAVFGFIAPAPAPAPAPARRGAARRKQARAANAGQDHRCRTRDGVDRRAPARRRAPGSGVLLKRAASGLSRAGPSAPLPPGAAGRGSPRRAA